MTKDQTLAALGNQLDSFYSLQQVIDIVKNIEEGSSSKVTKLDIARAIDRTIDSLENESRNNIVDFDSAEFCMNYGNKVELEDIRVNFDFIKEALENNFDDLGEEEDDIVELERGEND